MLARHQGDESIRSVGRLEEHLTYAAEVAGRQSKKVTVGRVPPLSIELDQFRMFLFVLVILTISRVHQHFHFLRPFRPLLVLVAVAVLYAYMNPRFLASGSMFRTWPARVMAGLGIMACLSVPFGISMGNSGKFILEDYSKVLLLAFLIIAAIRHVRDLYNFVWGLAISSGILAYLSIFVFPTKVVGKADLERIHHGYTYDSNDLGVVALVGLVFTLLTFQISRSKGKLISLIIIAGLGMTTAKTGSRGAFVGLMALGLALVVLLKHVSLDKRIGFVLVTALGLMVAAPEGYWRQMLTIFNPTGDYNWSAETGRRHVFMRGLGYVASNPLTGIGIDNFGRAEGMLSQRAEAREFDPTLPGIKWSSAHNTYLQAAAETGLPGLILVATLTLGGIVAMSRLRRRLPKHWQRGDPEEQFLFYLTAYLPVALVTFSVSGCFVAFAYTDLFYILGALMAGTYVSVEQKLNQQRGEAAPVTLAPRRHRGGLPPVVAQPLAPPPASSIGS